MRLAVLLVLSGCIVHRGNGDAASETTALEEVVDVENATALTMVVESGATEESAVVTCDSNLLEFIELDVFEDALVVRVTPGVEISPKTTCGIAIAVATLEALRSSGSGSTSGGGDLTGFEDARVSGSGPLELEGIPGGDIGLRNSGSGALTVSGAADRIDVNLSGSGAIGARDLAAVDAIVTSSGSGGVTVTATRDIEVHLTGSGSVDVYGDPAGTVVIDDTGSGSVTLN